MTKVTWHTRIEKMRMFYLYSFYVTFPIIEKDRCNVSIRYVTQNSQTYLPKILWKTVVVCHCGDIYSYKDVKMYVPLVNGKENWPWKTYCSDWFFIDITLLLRAINIGGCNKKVMNTDFRVLFLQLICYIIW